MRHIIRIGLVLFLMVALFLCASPVVYADDPPDEDSDTVVDIEIDGDLKVDIDASGPAELNVGVEGPSKVKIDITDEVKLDVEASDELEVIVNEQELDEPLRSDGQSGKLVPIVAGAIPLIGLISFLVIRRKKSKRVET